MTEPGNHGLTPAGDRAHAAYVLRKLAEQAEINSIRNPIDWRNEVDRWGNRQILHDAFMLGDQQLLNRTAEQGWHNEVVLHTPHGL
ncbi:hypothetical protein, partial [Nocardia acidivorans]|uniref:hypothetical protein n=1 Tax=Nocardia acidivorans TaxID=404580 RepID=UPI000A9B9DAD